MVKYLQQHKLILSLALVVLVTILLISACNLLNLGGQETPAGPSTPTILAPADGTKVLAGAPVQIQSAHPGDNVARVELWVQKRGENAGTLVRADVPINGIVLQQWVPQQADTYTITVRTYYTNVEQFSAVSHTFEVISDQALSLAAVATPPAQQPSAVQPTVIPLTPLAISPGEAAAAFTPDAGIKVVPTITPMPTPSPTPFYPPPPPIPGVPSGPLQSPQLKVHPPVCDSAEYLGPYKGNTSQRIFIPTDDMLPAKVTAATTVHRAWQIRNTGTCTWGPGYELAFYGGRSMGSGGAAFESVFPAEPGRRNVELDTSRLIVPQGKPNQIAVVEVLLTTPAIPGIHQSYWRMRNPQGIFFGPIVGVTMEVVRECTPLPGEQRIYGAPYINNFGVVGIGSVFQPTPIPVAAVTPIPATPIPPTYLAELGQVVNLEWDVIDAQNIDIVIEDPTGNIRRETATELQGRTDFEADRLGDFTATLYADNGSCTATQQVRVRVGPAEDEQFVISNLAFASSAPVDTSADAAASVSSAIAPNTVEVTWNYFNPDVKEFRLVAQQQLKTADTSLQCTYLSVCSEVWQSGQTIQSEQFDRNSADTTGREVLTDISSQLCQGAASGTRRIQYYMEAIKGSDISGPTKSNTVTVDCQPSASIAPAPTLSREMPEP